jgi:diaminopimelate decarboxylase
MNKEKIIIDKIINLTKKTLNKKDNYFKANDFDLFIKKAIKKQKILLESTSVFGTPQYILDEEELIKRTKELHNVLKSNYKKYEIFYAFKSNDLPYLINILKKENVNADVASKFELMLALKLKFKKIIFTCPVKSNEELKLCIKNSNKVILNIDNFDEIDNLILLLDEKNLKNKLKISFRLTPENNNSSWSKFGFTKEECKIAIKKIKENKNLKLAGFHFHLSWNHNAQGYVENIKSLGNFLKTLSVEDKEDLEFIDIGGGFLVNASSTYYTSTKKGKLIEMFSEDDNMINKILLGNFNKSITEKIDDINKFIRDISIAMNKYIYSEFSKEKLAIYLEPGRYLSSIPTYILLKVISIKRNNIFVDGGINLVGYSIYDIENYPIINITNPSFKLNKAKIYGTMCDPNDHFGFNYYGEKCKIGDFLAIMHQGAYTFSTAWRWQKPIAPYIAFNKGKIKLIKKEETFKDRYSGCLF